MLVLFKDGEIFSDGQFHDADLLVCCGKIEKIGQIDFPSLKNSGLDLDVIDCTNKLVIPGLIDSQIHLAGGSGENGFLSQPPRILIEECIVGGITTTIGTIGTDTTTKTMSNLIASVKAFKEAGLSSYAYTGGYEIPPATVTGRVRDDMIFVEEIIGLGEIAIADRRVPEPTPNELAREVVDAYVGGTLTNKAGVSRINVGAGSRRLKLIHEMSERHEIQFDHLYFTHMDRSRELLKEGVEIARKGSFIDLDIHERDLGSWYKYYLELDGPLSQLSFSTDAGACGPNELWNEIQVCALKHNFKLEQLIPHVTSVPAKVLKLSRKGHLIERKDADLIVTDKKDLNIHHVMANGQFFYRDQKFHYADQLYTARRKADWYGLRK